jgi:hypothetical protein
VAGAPLLPAHGIPLNATEPTSYDPALFVNLCDDYRTPPTL